MRLKSLRDFERRVFRKREFARVGNERAKLESPFGVSCTTAPRIGLALVRRNLPLRRRGCDQHLARSGSGGTHHRPAIFHAAAAAGAEIVERRRPGRSLHQLDARPIRAQFIGQHHGERGADALAHFRFADRQRDRAVRIDSHPSIRLELVRLGRKNATPSKPMMSDAPPSAAVFRKVRRDVVITSFSPASTPPARLIALRIRG